jgi:proteic killer suppression protein
MKIRDFAHKGLKRLCEEDNAKGVPAESADKLRKMLAFLGAMDDDDELSMLPNWKAHRLTGERKGAWSLSVTGSLRMTFRVDPVEREIYGLSLEDYH